MSGDVSGPGDDRDQLDLATAFLNEAVYRSRGGPAPSSPFASPARDLSATGVGGCGLGAKPAVVLDLSPRAEGIYGQLFGAESSDGSVDGSVDRGDRLASIQAVMTRWIRKQDGLDRKRNHFLKDFRAEHGADRRSYSADLLAAYESGLAAVNQESIAGLEAAARELLAMR